MGILVRTTGAVVFPSSGKMSFPELLNFFVISRTRFRRKNGKGIGSNSGRIMSNPFKSLKNLGRKEKKRSDPKGGEVMKWYILRIRLR